MSSALGSLHRLLAGTRIQQSKTKKPSARSIWIALDVSQSHSQSLMAWSPSTSIAAAVEAADIRYHHVLSGCYNSVINWLQRLNSEDATLKDAL